MASHTDMVDDSEIRQGSTMLDKSRFELYHLMPTRQFTKVVFSNFDHFVKDILDVDISTVRIEAFEEVQPTELSFIQHVTMMLYVTARDSSTCTLYEYVEPIGRWMRTDTDDANADSICAEDCVHMRIKQIEESVRQIIPCVRRGRYVVEQK